MELAEIALALVATVVLVTALCRRVSLSAPLILTALGAVVSFVPAMPEVHLDPHVVLVGFLPPLLYAAAINTSLIDLGRERRQIIGLSVFLVLATAFAVAGVTWALVAAVPFAFAVALGGVVAPPDAVAATAVARRIGLPRRIVSILEGESLFNDATALVVVSMALEAATHEVTGLDIAVSFVRSAAGGVLIGYLAYRLLKLVRRHLRDAVTNVTVSFMAPWVAYVPAEIVHASGVVAVVVCGVLLAHTSPVDQTASARVAQRMNWASIQFILENLVFLLIGLQARTILDEVRTSELGLARTFLIAFAVLLTVIVVRPIWMLAFAMLGRSRDSATSLSLRESAATGWAGMRGVVTLAAAFLLPQDTPERALLVFTALVVTIGTLTLQGFTLGPLARKLDLHGPDPREEALQYAQMLQMTVNAGERRLDDELQKSPGVPDDIVGALRLQAQRRVNPAWERLGSNDPDVEAPSTAYRRLRSAMLESEREKLLHLRDRGVIDHEVLSEILAGLDVEESMIARVNDRDERFSDATLLTPEVRRFGCEDLQDVDECVEPLSHDGCPRCTAEGLHPVALRMCLSCGEVACCDSSVGKHATAHYEQTGHPVMRSFEPGEAWRWCYVHHLLG
ncbi:Na+/H+ antiporter [Yimella sp. cx-51]|uniref:Na+/H+ antiporter n=1 Tax=Yimella sp. cx-51 TaxID=2770551 RepID=UPI00165DD0D2|nr:Na+/H+ antiporter [Yimella sp. cx-51]MBC9958132.1 Na+/H+ antiporter [Yimella sp. cx-51]QTH38829.1 Na+/H+ antiporter [Yimella sp. cx-51]